MYTTEELRKKYQEEFNVQHPPTHYNDIAGFAEVYWDGGTRIMLQFFFLGNRRTKFGMAVSAGLESAGVRPELVSARQFYPLYVQPIEASGIPNVACCEEVKRQAIIDALDKVAKTAAGMKCYVNLTHERTVLNALTLDRLFSE